jgi:hypothetical protein
MKAVKPYLPRGGFQVHAPPARRHANVVEPSVTAKLIGC